MRTGIIQGFRLSPQQRHLWLLQEAGEGQPYRVECEILIEGHFDRAVLNSSIARVAAEHEILRTTFHSLPEMIIPVQVIPESEMSPERLEDLTGWTAEQQDDRIEALRDEAHWRPFDFENGPVLQLTKVVLAPDKLLLIIGLPALCADSATVENLLGEFRRAYASAARRETSEEAVQYVDLSEWQNEILEADYATAGKEFWREQNLSALTALKLPFENQVSERCEFNPQFIRVRVEPEATARIKTLAAQYEIPLSICLLACWQILLGRLTGQTQMIVGVAYDGRNYQELETALGLFTRYLPVACSLAGDLRFAEVLKEVSEVSRDAGKWQQCFTWEQRAASAQDGYDASFFPFCFEHVKRPANGLAAGVSFSLSRQYACLDRFKVKLACVEDDDSLSTEFHFDAALIASPDVRHLASQFQTLLESVASNPQANIAQLEILSEAARAELLAEFNNTEVAYSPDACVHELFERQVERRPDAPAIVCEEQLLTYAELNAQANQLAHHLRSLGVGMEVRVGLCVQRSAEMLVGLLAILKAGGAYVPLDSDYPKIRLSKQLTEARAHVLLTQHSLLSHMPDFQGEVRCLDTDRHLWDTAPENNPTSSAIPEGLVYVIYTSGSTGVPKAVGVTHRNLVNYTRYLRGRIGLDELPPDDKLNFATVTTLSADLGNTAIFGALLSGGCLHIISYEVATNSAKMAAYMTGHRVDVLKIVSSHMNALLAADAGAKVLPRRQLIMGGEALSAELAGRISALASDCKILNHYGPTEATVGALTYALDGNEREWRARATVPIGRPIANAQAYVLDEQMRPVAVGITGELYLGGCGLARGYLNNAGQTAESFVPHPFSTTGGERLYRTGDLARYLADGKIEFLGRVDEQVKVRGYRIEPGEIEAVLKQHEGVQEAIVIAREDEPGRKRLVAYVVPETARAAVIEGKARYQLPNNMFVVQQNEHETDFFYQQIFVDQTNLKHGIRLPEGACVFDVGANIGLFTLYTSLVCKDAQIYAFEPVPPTFASLRINAFLYGGNVRLYDCGLSDRNQKVKFTYYPQSSCMSGYYADAERDRETLSLILKQQQKDAPEMAALTPYLDEILDERIKSESFVCQLRTISEIIRENAIARIDLLKIDVEKSELDVLMGIADDDWEKVRNLVIEAHDVGGQLARLTDLLEGRGYRVVVEQDSSLDKTGLFNIFATLDPAAGDEWNRVSPEHFRVRHHSILTVDELQSDLKVNLPTHMLPSALVILESLPLTANGKLDRRALPSPEEARADKIEYAAPRNEMENILVTVWQKVLGVTPVGIHNDYFALGGDSLRVIQIVHEVSHHGLTPTVMDVLRNPTVYKLARYLRENQGHGSRNKSLPWELIKLMPSQSALLPDEAEDAYPASKMQEFVIYHYEHDEQQAGVYHIQQSYHIHDPEFSLPAFKRALEMMVHNHPVLRTTFIFDAARQPIQVVEKNPALTVTEENLKHLSAPEQDQYIEAAIRHDRTRPFDVTKTGQPLFRLSLFYRSEQAFEFFISMHHAIMDGWGNQEFSKELVELYLTLRNGEEKETAPVVNTYKEFVALEREIISSADAQNFWHHHLQDHRPTRLRRLAATTEPSDETSYLHPLNSEVAGRLHRSSRDWGVSLKAILLSSYLDLMSLETSAETVTVGVVSNGRSERLSNPLKALGLFWNIVPFCARIESGDKSIQVRKVQDALIDIEPYATYPLAQILADRQTNELFFSTFNYLHFHNMKEMPTQRSLKVVGFKSHDKFHFPLNYVLSVDPFNGSIAFRVEYDRSYFSHESIRSMTGNYIDLLMLCQLP